MKKMKKGDIVRITSAGDVYATHFQWMEENAPEYLPIWEDGYADCYSNKIKRGQKAIFIKKAPHGIWGETVALVIIHDHAVMIRIEGIEKL